MLDVVEGNGRKKMDRSVVTTSAIHTVIPVFNCAQLCNPGNLFIPIGRTTATPF